jgi:GNAT superfamily N-acetyltransferase
MASRRKLAPEARIAAEKQPARAATRLLWRGLVRYNRQVAGPLRYTRVVLTARERGKIVGGLILDNYWLESYVELLWMSARMRGRDVGTRLIAEAEKRARRRGSKLLHLNTFSFQAPRFYEKLGFRRFGALHGSPKGASRYYYVKRI